MERREDLAIMMNADIGELFCDLDSGVLELPDLELLLPSGDLSDDLVASLLPLDETCDNPIAALDSEEVLTVSVNNPSNSTSLGRETELVTRELKFLEAQRDFLQFKAESGLKDGETEQEEQEKVDEEKVLLEVARDQQKMLVDAMKQHQRSVGDLHQLMLQASPMTHYRMTLMTPMESYIRLGRDPVERRSKLLEMRDEKLDTVRRFMAAQSRGIDPMREFFYVDTFERFGKFYTVDFSISLVRGMTVAEVAEVIQDQFVVPHDGVSRLLGCVTNRTYFDGMPDTFLHARTVERVDLPERSCGERSFLVQESNAVFYLKRFTEAEVGQTEDTQSGEQGDLTVMMSDFVDVDELHPYRSHSRVRKDISVGITLRRYVGPGCAEGVVMKRFSFVKHHLGRRTTKTEVVNTISTRVLLWGQAVRLCIAERRRQKRDAPKRIWNTHTFPHSPRTSDVTPQPQKCASVDL